MMSRAHTAHSHNAVGLVAANRTQRPVDAAGAEDQGEFPQGLQYSVRAANQRKAAVGT
jgi:hypothetical protein